MKRLKDLLRSKPGQRDAVKEEADTLAALMQFSGAALNDCNAGKR